MQKKLCSYVFEKIGLLSILLLWLLVPLFSQDQANGLAPGSSSTTVVLRQAFSGPYTMVERSNWARYDNGKYIGHVYREVRYQLRPVQEQAAIRYNGTVYVFDETLRDLQKSARSLDDILPVEFTLTPAGVINIKHDRGYPALRNFPQFVDTPILPGDRWVGQGQRVVDPRNDGNRVNLPILVEYVFQGSELYKGEPVYRIRAQYATRYKASSRSGQGGNGPFTQASGTHIVDILIRTSDGRLVLMRDNLDETFTWSDGSSVRYKGFTLTFSEGFLPYDRGTVVAQLERQFGGGEATTGSGIQKGADASGAGSAGGPGTAAETGRIGGSGTVAGDERITRAGSESPQSGTGDFQLDLGHGGSGIADSVAGRAGAVLDIPDQNIEIANVPEGVKLTIRDIRFVADSDQILPAERGRLDMIAQALKSILQSSPNKPMILVEGHTAAVGKPSGELDLSVQRAKKIVDELVLRGIPAERFMYKGWGGTKPIADNTTEPGRAKNRRVEITILDGLSSN